MKLLLKLAFDGSAYCGWQAQKNAMSIQETLTRAASSVYGFPCAITGCSRTDSGVHAKAYFATLEYSPAYLSVNPGAIERDITDIIPAEAIPRALNSVLPPDIAVISADIRNDGFHARYSVKSKKYEYLFYWGAVRDPFYAGRALWISSAPCGSHELVGRMNAAAASMTGKRDFAAFMASGSKISDTTRTVYECGVAKRDDLIVFYVSADGFLYNMVRIMAGTALAAARKYMTSEEINAEIDSVIASRCRKNAGETLPPYGLYLCDAKY